LLAEIFAMDTLQAFIVEHKTYINLFWVAIIFTITFLFAKFVRYAISNLIIKKTNDVITGDFIGRIFWIIVFATGLLLCLEKLGLKSFSNKLLAGAGLTTFIIGFALKDIGENFLAGIVLALNKPFRVGDIIQIDNIIGIVEEVTLRETTIKTVDGKDIYIPNSKLITNPLTNYTIDGFQRFELNLELEISKTSITELMDELKHIVNKHNSIIEEKDKITEIHLTQIKQNNIYLQIYYWLNDFHFTTNEQQIKTSIILSLRDYCTQHEIKLINIK
jgi:small conductance mechanosensitive channel